MQKNWYRQGTDLLKEIRDTKLSDDTLAFWYLGQCGFVFKKSATVYIDPVKPEDCIPLPFHQDRYWQTMCSAPTVIWIIWHWTP